MCDEETSDGLLIKDGIVVRCRPWATIVYIPESVNTIGNNAFRHCTSLTSVTIGDGVTAIEYASFYNCTSLTSVTIPESVSWIGSGAFDNCRCLIDVYCLAENVPETDSSAFKNSPISSATLHVHAESIDAYKSTSPWSEFGNIVAMTEDEIDGIRPLLTFPKEKEQVYNRNGHQIVNGKSSNRKLQNGINIIRYSDGTTKKVMVK